MRLGFHVNGDKTTAPKYVKESGANFFQMFLQPPKSANAYKQSDDKLKTIKKNMKKHRCTCVVHSPYVINLARDPKDPIHYKGVNTIIADLNSCAKIGAVGAVIHMGKNVKSLKLSKEKAFKNYVKGVTSALKQSDPKSTLILETGAGCGTEICTPLEELAKIRSKVPKKYRNRVKFCIDTCHVFAAGYQLNKIDYIDEFGQLIEDTLGWENVAVVHLNDSKDPCNSKKDHHEIPGKGNIGFKQLVKFISICCENDVPVVLETPVEYDGERIDHKTQVKKIKTRLKKKYGV